MRFPGLDSNETYKSLKVSEIESVKLYMYEGTGNSGTSTLQVRFSLNDSGWSESSPIYANTKANGKVMSTTTIKKSGVCSFDFTELAIASKYAGYDIKKGIVITNANETNASLRRSFYMTEYSSSKPRVVVEWNPVIDGMAYVFKTSSSKCIECFGDSILENDITTNGYNSNEYINPDQIWITKKSLAGGYLIYSAKNSSDAIYATLNDSVAIYKCTSEINLYYCWDFERITSSTYAIKNKYSSKWLYKKSDGSIALTDNQANRLIFTKATSNYPSSWKGGYSGQSGTYKLNIIFSNQTDYNDLANAAEAWNGICDKVCVKAYPPNSNPSTGLNVTVARKNLSTAGIENASTAYAVFLPNSTATNYIKTQNDITIECNKNWSNGVIFINIDKEGFYSLNNEKRSSTITHEVGHALKLCHSDDTTSQGNRFGVVTLMSNDSSTVNKDITLYDKSSLIKKWREMT